MTPLETRKQMLVTESELNRLQMVEDLNLVHTEVVRLKEQAQPWISLALAAHHVVARWARLEPNERNGDGKTSTWLGTLIHGARAGLTLWLGARARRR